MIYNVLIVDDSTFFQNRLKAMVNEHPNLNVTGVATNGQEAIDLARSLKPHVISMDYEMPMVDGVTAVKAIMAEQRVPIIMFSSLTFDGARITLDALDAGAVDFISKNFSQISQNSKALKIKVHTTFLSFAKQYYSQSQTENKTPIAHIDAVDNYQPPKKEQVQPKGMTVLSPSSTTKLSGIEPVNNESELSNSLTPSDLAHNSQSGHTVFSLKAFRPRGSRLIIIGSSTGGPVAIHSLLNQLPNNFELPILIIQHMPPNFTRALAQRLNNVCALDIREARNGDPLQAGSVLIAPGGMQCIFDANNCIKLVAGDDRVNYKPSVDLAFTSAANHFGRGVLGIMLTGMGTDGCEGAKIIKQKGGVLWSQDESSCVVYGMPKALVDAGLSDYSLEPSELGAALTRVQ